MNQPGVYLLKYLGAPVYIGKSNRVFGRVVTQAKAFSGKFTSVEVILCYSQQHATELEAALIKEHKPTFNRAINPLHEYPCGADRKPFKRYP